MVCMAAAFVHYDQDDTIMQKICNTWIVPIIIAIGVMTAPGAFLVGQEIEWRQLAGPYGGGVTAVAASQQGSMFAGTRHGHIYRAVSADGVWEEIFGDAHAMAAREIQRLSVLDNGDIFALTDNGMYRSRDNGDTWNRMSIEITSIIESAPGTLLAAGPEGIQGSTDDGATWGPRINGIESVEIGSLVYGRSEGVAYAARLQGPQDLINPRIFRTSDNGLSWQESRVGFILQFSRITDLTVDVTGTLFASTIANLFRYNAFIDHWDIINSEAGDTRSVAAIPQGGLAVAGGIPVKNLFRYFSDDGTWILVNGANANFVINDIAFDAAGNAIIATATGGVLVAKDGLTDWQDFRTGLNLTNFSRIKTGADGVVLATGNNRMYSSSDNGREWQTVNRNTLRNALAFCGSNRGYLFVSLADGSGVLRSADNGASWQTANGGIENRLVTDLSADSEGNVYGITEDNVVVYSGNDGASWQVAEGLPLPEGRIIELNHSSQLPMSSIIIDRKVYTRESGDNTWQQLIIDEEMLQGRIVGSFLVTANGTYVMSVSTVGIFRSTDQGGTWSKHTEGLPIDIGVELAGPIDLMPEDSDGVLFANISPNGVYRSLDNGVTWHAANTGLPSSPGFNSAGEPIDDVGVWEFVVNDGGLFVSSRDDAYRSTDQGDSWQPLSAGPGSRSFSDYFVTPSDEIFALHLGKGVKRLGDPLQGWLTLSDGLDQPTGYAIHPDGDLIGVEGHRIIKRSLDGGNTWQTVHIQNLDEPFISGSPHISHSGEILVPAQRTILRSLDNGITWSATPLTLLPSNFDINFVRTHPEDANIIVVIAQNGNISDNRVEVERSIDNGASWISIHTTIEELDTDINGRRITAAAINRKGDVFIGADKGLIGLRNEATNWNLLIDAGADRNIVDILVDDNDHLYVASGFDSGSIHRAMEDPFNTQSWEDFGAGLALDGERRIQALALDPEGYVLAGVRTAGLFRAVMKTVDVAESDPDGSSSQGSVRCYPNPSYSTTTFAITLTRPAPAELVIYDAFGNAVETLAIAATTERQTFSWNARNSRGARVPAGMYYAVLKVEGKRVNATPVVYLSAN